MRGPIIFLSVLVFAITCITGLVWDYHWNRDCGDYLKLAGDAPTVEKAHEFLTKAVTYIESHGLTEGNTGIIFHRTTNDLGLWYGNVLGAKATVDTLVQQLQQNPESVPQLTRDNALMKIREVVLDHSKDGQDVTAPDWVSMHPYQGLYWIIFWVSLVAGVIAIIPSLEF